MRQNKQRPFPFKSTLANLWKSKRIYSCWDPNQREVFISKARSFLYWYIGVCVLVILDSIYVVFILYRFNLQGISYFLLSRVKVLGICMLLAKYLLFLCSTFILFVEYTYVFSIFSLYSICPYPSFLSNQNKIYVLKFLT